LELAPAEDVEVNVVYGLASVCTGVDHYAIAAIHDALLLGDMVAGEQDAAKQLDVGVVRFPQGSDVLARDDECVRGCLGVDVVEGYHRVILEDDVRAHQPFRQPAKYTSI
jgi:hypothetical protein